MQARINVRQLQEFICSCSSRALIRPRETLEDPHKAQLICEAQALRIPATLGDLRQVCLGQGRVVDQLASRRKNHGQVSRKTGVLIDDI